MRPYPPDDVFDREGARKFRYDGLLIRFRLGSSSPARRMAAITIWLPTNANPHVGCLAQRVPLKLRYPSELQTELAYGHRAKLLGEYLQPNWGFFSKREFRVGWLSDEESAIRGKLRVELRRLASLRRDRREALRSEGSNYFRVAQLLKDLE